jgi:hypothetical protein
MVEAGLGLGLGAVADFTMVAIGGATRSSTLHQTLSGVSIVSSSFLIHYLTIRTSKSTNILIATRTVLSVSLFHVNKLHLVVQPLRVRPLTINCQLTLLTDNVGDELRPLTMYRRISTLLYNIRPMR